MLQSLNNQANFTRTENGAHTYRTTGSDCLDLFATVGALRGASDDEITTRFLRSWAEDPDLSMKILFYARDVRGGLGERRVFRTIVRWLAENEPGSLNKNLAHFAEFGRWDDLLALLGTPCEQEAIALIGAQLQADLEALESGGSVSLLGKWLPSVNTSSADSVRAAKRIARRLGLSDAAYRKTLVKLRSRIRILENNLRTKDYTFDYEAQPSKAMFKYRRAFLRNDQARYQTYLARVAAGQAKLNTGTLAPYDIVAPFFQRTPGRQERQAIDATWNAQEDFTGGENALVVVDGSGSMYNFYWDPSPAAVALSLGIYFAERNTGAFHNHFITFSRSPQLVQIKGKDILDKLRYCRSFNEAANTDLQRVFQLILRTALANQVPQSQMPARLYIISDMEFDTCVEGGEMTNFQYARELFARHGYELPQVVFWNVASRSRQQPVTQNEQGVALVSGCSPRIFSLLTSGSLNPYDCMMEILGSDRYAAISA